MESAMAKKLVEKEIEQKKLFIDKCPEMVEVVRKFDGKVLNKRLETELRKVYHVRMEYDKTFNWWELIGYVDDRMVQSDEADKWGYRSCAYIKDDRFYIATCCRDLTDENGRLIADKLIEKIGAECDRQIAYVNSLRDQLSRIEEIKAECARIRRERSEFINNTHAMIREYFGLEV